MQYKNKMFLLLMLMIITLLLQSCADVAMTGVQAIYNRRSLEKNIKDQYISLRAFKAIHIDDSRFRDTNISVATFNGEVLLAGEAPSAWQRRQVENKIKAIPNVQKVYNLVDIKSPSSNLQRVSDAWITAKVKAKLIASNDVDPSQIKVVTENGVVYLMGILPPNEADAAVQLASETGGVEKVVKVFSYIHIDKNSRQA